MRIGVFGGSFDPVHLGHLRLAECCQRQAGLDEVHFVPAARQPHKPHGPVAAAADRVAMLRLAVADRPGFVVSTAELDRGGPSYTVDTLRQLTAGRPGDDFFFMMGADSLADFPNWREPEEISRLATLLVVRRAGAGEPDFQPLRPFMSAERLEQMRASQVEMPATPISSSQVRRLISEGGAWEPFVPPAVAAYIQERDLYTT
jgi:nicotinate-nucleotide adenylyltransferase